MSQHFHTQRVYSTRRGKPLHVLRWNLSKASPTVTPIHCRAVLPEWSAAFHTALPIDSKGCFSWVKWSPSGSPPTQLWPHWFSVRCHAGWRAAGCPAECHSQSISLGFKVTAFSNMLMYKCVDDVHLGCWTLDSDLKHLFSSHPHSSESSFCKSGCLLCP